MPFSHGKFLRWAKLMQINEYSDQNGPELYIYALVFIHTYLRPFCRGREDGKVRKKNQILTCSLVILLIVLE